jgi:hypothetical protein
VVGKNYRLQDIQLSKMVKLSAVSSQPSAALRAACAVSSTQLLRHALHLPQLHILRSARIGRKQDRRILSAARLRAFRRLVVAALA